MVPRDMKNTKFGWDARRFRLNPFRTQSPVLGAIHSNSKYFSPIVPKTRLQS